MNYLEEIKSFYVWLETNTLTTPAVALWHALMHTSDRAGCPDEFTIAYSTLSAKTGLKKDAIVRARQALQQSGRINFRSRAGQQSAIYQIIPLASFKTIQGHSVDLTDANREQADTNPSANRAQGASIITLSSSASPSTSEEAGENESFYKAHERVFGFPCNPFQANQLGVYIDQDGVAESVVVRAIERAAAASTGYNFKFILRILNDYFCGGAKTLPQAIALDEAFEARKQQATAGARELLKQQRKSYADVGRGMPSEPSRDGATV